MIEYVRAQLSCAVIIKVLCVMFQWIFFSQFLCEVSVDFLLPVSVDFLHCFYVCFSGFSTLSSYVMFQWIFYFVFMWCFNGFSTPSSYMMFQWFSYWFYGIVTSFPTAFIISMWCFRSFPTPTPIIVSVWLLSVFLAASVHCF